MCDCQLTTLLLLRNKIWSKTVTQSLQCAIKVCVRIFATGKLKRSRSKCSGWTLHRTVLRLMSKWAVRSRSRNNGIKSKNCQNLFRKATNITLKSIKATTRGHSHIHTIATMTMTTHQLFPLLAFNPFAAGSSQPVAASRPCKCECKLSGWRKWRMREERWWEEGGEVTAIDCQNFREIRGA